ncbi:hypothetical protein KIK06_01130 [Nocardiopsis sp. EMB25]|uniref:Flp family type IVb pilin n=1 Tax=Nocardiopsis sp. EMB25 TaxID=2835867 RepID=UPI0022841D7F|nr:hypothetical protein [Nocardiopsis sp. EMB25]MCY9782490.1 hypothetical protein [Nocardiopsis sp. EMB25]
MSSLTKLWVFLSTRAVPSPRRDDRGAGMVEYAAIVILVAAIATAIFQLGLIDNISGAIGNAVDDVLDGPQQPVAPAPTAPANN